ncbi:MAG TPA: hypothetical protein VIQ11_23435, partial [Mycobacterium sp.]
RDPDEARDAECEPLCRSLRTDLVSEDLCTAHKKPCSACSQLLKVTTGSLWAVVIAWSFIE